MKAKVHVRLKEGVLDPQGAAIGQSAAASSASTGVGEVRQGKLIELELGATRTSDTRLRSRS